MKTQAQAFQPPLEFIELLPPPEASDIEGIAQLACDIMIAHVGKVATVAGGPHSIAKVDPDGDVLDVCEIPGPDGNVPVIILGYLSEDKVMENVLAVEGGMDWEDASEDMPEVEGKAAVISIEFNRRWSAHEVCKHGVMGFYEVLEVLAHEIGHAFDGDTTEGDPDYADADGHKQKLKYAFDEGEMRARVWAALVVYTHVYAVCKITERWDDYAAPAKNASCAEWLKFIEQSPVEDIPLDELNADNKAWLVEQIRTIAPAVTDRYEALMQEEEYDPPPLFSPIDMANELTKNRFPAASKATPQQIDEASMIVVEKAAELWSQEEE